MRHVISGIPGAAHDANAITWSRRFIEFLDALPDGTVALGDAGYTGVHPKLVVPFRGNNLTQQQLRFNHDVSKIRQIVERSISNLQNKWRILQMKEARLPAKYGVHFASECVISACVLHNRYTNYM